MDKHNPQLLILPEDKANCQIANGFFLNLNIKSRSFRVLPIAGGWTKVLKKFKTDHLDKMRRCPDRKMVFLIDFDENKERLDRIKKEIPQDLIDSVFVLGVWSEPEKLKKKTGKDFETIGKALAEGCPISRNELWSDELLQHNETELDRMIPLVKSFLFEKTE
ncbi:MAG: hypothetical protein CDV28_1645 [Candidatus Electronema aureum]|uniref:Uncharacterized protein n=1 Tax=Candidatus Electronema aureum TaxID=2005002 RepID=A0A521FYL7_9BACT|nr:MAG: hypothetical protein CDV28_1645 [Candidatus Electronema aureum]